MPAQRHGQCTPGDLTLTGDRVYVWPYRYTKSGHVLSNEIQPVGSIRPAASGAADEKFTRMPNGVPNQGSGVVGARSPYPGPGGVPRSLSFSISPPSRWEGAGRMGHSKLITRHSGRVRNHWHDACRLRKASARKLACRTRAQRKDRVAIHANRGRHVLFAQADTIAYAGSHT